MDLCGNEVPLTWLALNRGYELKPLESETERKLRETEARLAEKERELEVIADFMRRAKA